jgi:hypothetical protein
MYRSASRMPPLFRAADDAERAPVPPAASRGVTTGPAFLHTVDAELELLVRSYGGRVTFLFLSPFEGGPDVVEKTFIDNCASRGWSCVDFRGTFADFRARGDAPFGFPNSRFGVGHLNARGHAAAARLLTTELRRLRARGLF